MATHEQWLAEAVRLAVENVEAGSGGPFGAVIVRGGEVVASGANSVTPQNDPTAHAEIVAIRRACAALGVHHLVGGTLYASCEPCPMCLAACYWARLDAVYFAATHEDAARAGFDDSFLYAELRKPLPERRLPMTRISLGESGTEFARWEAAAGKTHY